MELSPFLASVSVRIRANSAGVVCFHWGRMSIRICPPLLQLQYWADKSYRPALVLIPLNPSWLDAEIWSCHLYRRRGQRAVLLYPDSLREVNRSGSNISHLFIFFRTENVWLIANCIYCHAFTNELDSKIKHRGQ